jgi:hypothetical protein
VFSSPQARCLQTAIVALVEHDALSSGTTFKGKSVCRRISNQ